MLIRLTLVDDDDDLHRRLERVCDLPDLVFTAYRGSAGDGGEEADLLLVRREHLAAPLAEAVGRLRAGPERPDLIVLRDDEDPIDRAELLAAGCLAVLNLSVSDETLCAALETMAERRSRTMGLELAQTAAPPLGYADEHGAAMRDLLALARRVASADASVFILGETGVGKEWLARLIHRQSGRAQQPFVGVNCAALPKHLLESELFGHEKGAFTGAERARRGYFELAHGGTLFLDEIGDLPPDLQSKLLRVLQERSFHRVGGERELRVDLRILAATSREPSELRSDLYYRIAVVELRVPPLRKRREEIPHLAQRFLERFARQCGRPARRFERRALKALVAYPWPGNVRELMNIMERTALLSERDLVTAEDLPASIRSAGEPSPSPRATPSATEELASNWLERPLREVRRAAADGAERAWLEAQLRDCRGRVSEVARRAGIDPRSLFDKMRSHGLRKENYR